LKYLMRVEFPSSQGGRCCQARRHSGCRRSLQSNSRGKAGLGFHRPRVITWFLPLRFEGDLRGFPGKRGIEILTVEGGGPSSFSLCEFNSGLSPEFNGYGGPFPSCQGINDADCSKRLCGPDHLARNSRVRRSASRKTSMGGETPVHIRKECTAWWMS